MNQPPPNRLEAARLRRLELYSIVDSAPEQDFENIVQLASTICGTPVAGIGLVDETRQWLKAAVGMPTNSIPREHSICNHIVSSGHGLEVRDLSKDARFSNNPYVAGGPMLRFYAGEPLTTPDGLVLGTLAVLDTQPRELNAVQRQALQSLASYVIRLMDLRVMNAQNRATVESLRLSEERFRLVTESMSDGLLSFNGCANIEFANRRMASLLGYEPSEFPGRPIASLFTPEHGAIAQEKVRRYLAGSEERTINWDGFETTLLHRDGSVVPAELSIGEYITEGSRRLTIVVRDLRARKEAEASRAQLVESSKLSVLGEMSASVAHEINNPLAVIVAQAENLQTMVEKNLLTPEKVLKVSDRIGQTSQRIAKIVRALLQFAREGSNTPMQPYPLRSLIEDCTVLCQERFDTHNVQLRVSALPSHLDLECRPIELSQVIMNLLNNAFDVASQSQGRWVCLEWEDHGEEIQLAVSDSGPGVPPELQEKIFQPFFTTKPVGKGSGIGLSLSRNITEAHGGRIWVDTQSPASRFVLRLPKRQATPAAKAA